MITLALLAVGTAGAFPPGDSSVRELIRTGQYATAVRLARNALAELEGAQDSDAGAFTDALDQLVVALCLNGQGAAPETLTLAERSLHLKQQTLAPAHDRLAASFHLLGNVFTERGDYPHALENYRRALALQNRSHGGAETGVVASTLEDLAHTLRLLERYREAEGPLDRALAIRRTERDDARIPLARTLEELAEVYISTGRVSDARKLLEQASGIRQSLQGEHPDFAETFSVFGDLCWAEGKFADARQHYERAVQLAQRLLWPEHPAVARYMRFSAEASIRVADFERARMLLEQAHAIVVRVLGPDHPERASLLTDLGWLNREQGNFIQARRSHEDALRILERRLGPNDPRVATILNNLAALHYYLGDLDHAIALQKRALAIWEKHVGAGEMTAREIGKAADLLARILSAAGRHVEARGMYARALRVRQNLSSPDELATTLTGLSITLIDLGDFALATRYLTRAFAIWNEHGPAEDAVFPTALEARAVLAERRGDISGARGDRERALRALERHRGPSNPEVGNAKARLAASLLRLNEPQSALALALDAEKIGRTHLRLTIPDLPERMALGYAATRPKGLGLLLSIVASGMASPADTRQVFDQVVQSRAVVLDEMAARQRAISDDDPARASLRTTLAQARQRYANLLVRGPEWMPRERYEALIEQAQERKEAAERALGQRSTQFQTELAQRRIGFDDVQHALPDDTALISFIAYEKAPTSSVGRAGSAVRSYVALVIRAGSDDIAAVSLGAAVTIDGLVARWRWAMTHGLARSTSMGIAERQYNIAGDALRRRLWDPLVPRLGGVRRVFVVPDGAINLVPLAALPIGDSEYLIERGPVIHYLSAERDLVTTGDAAVAGQGLLALGGPSFNDSTSFAARSRRPPVTPVTRTTLRGAIADCASLQSLHFEPLPFSADEAREVGEMWTAFGPGTSINIGTSPQVLVGRGATESTFKQRAPGSRILHLATHGFFLGGSCDAAPEGARGVGGLARAKPTSPRALTRVPENPLLLSGLAMAGANRRSAASGDEDDGILTAEEVASLSLAGVEWAVLSACDTGVGEVKAGEGIFGLRRAFKVAGARTVIMSLWAVDDRAARQWMRALYRGRLQDHLDTADAVQAASLSVLRERRIRHESPHPFFWAAFVAAGDWH